MPISADRQKNKQQENSDFNDLAWNGSGIPPENCQHKTFKQKPELPQDRNEIYQQLRKEEDEDHEGLKNTLKTNFHHEVPYYLKWPEERIYWEEQSV